MPVRPPTGDVEELLATHHRLTGARRAPADRLDLEDLALAYMTEAVRSGRERVLDGQR
jgi:hypothetical protein